MFNHPLCDFDVTGDYKSQWGMEGRAGLPAAYLKSHSYEKDFAVSLSVKYPFVASSELVFFN